MQVNNLIVIIVQNKHFESVIRR